MHCLSEFDYTVQSQITYIYLNKQIVEFKPTMFISVAIIL